MLALRRIRQRLETHRPAPASATAAAAEGARPQERQYLRWINASRGNGVQLITVDEICYFQSDAKYTRVVTAAGEALIRRSLKDLSDQLDPARFWQVHRSTIVNVDAIAGVTRNLAGAVQVKLKQRLERLDVSDAHKHLFRQM
jgi:DNA-binding LytR/AlgR family response regulator